MKLPFLGSLIFAAIPTRLFIKSPLRPLLSAKHHRLVHVIAVPTVDSLQLQITMDWIRSFNASSLGFNYSFKV